VSSSEARTHHCFLANSEHGASALRLTTPYGHISDMKNWNVSVALVPLYLGTFWIWRLWPSRGSFIVVGILSAVLMSLVIRYGQRRNYFANRLDLLLHIYVVIDILLEAFMWEFFLKLCRLLSFGAFTDTEELRKAIAAFHDNNNFYGCALFFVIVVGGHRWWALRERPLSGEDAL